jgi:phage-related protein
VRARKTAVVFYRSSRGTEPVRDWLKSLAPGERRAIGQDLMRVQFRWPVGMPLCKALSGGLWEVRSALPGRQIARVFFCFHEGELFVLHGFVKKTQKTPEQELARARKRMKDIVQ